MNKPKEKNKDVMDNSQSVTVMSCGVEEIDGNDLGPVPTKPIYTFAKRAFDLLVSATALIVLALPMLVIALLIRLSSPGPAIFRQKRMGQNGRPFVIYKFRTMRFDAPSDMAAREFRDSHQYITGIGAILRRTSMDELPQLLNVLVGQMSIVGFRPVCLTETKLNALRDEYGVFLTKPGITGYAQVLGRDHLTVERKALLDAEYARKRSIGLDIWCLFKTVSTVFTGEGVM